MKTFIIFIYSFNKSLNKTKKIFQTLFSTRIWPLTSGTVMAAGWVMMPGSRAKLTTVGSDANFSCFSLKEADGQDRGHSCSSASWHIQFDGDLPVIWLVTSATSSMLTHHETAVCCTEAQWCQNSSKITKFTWCNQIKSTSRSVETPPCQELWDKL